MPVRTTDRKIITARRSRRGQALVEFALALPIFLLIIYGIMEAGRAIFAIAAVTTASREAARYASAAGINDAGNKHYQDCVAIRNAAKKVGFLLNLQDSQITIAYDHGPGAGGTAIPNCTKTTSGPQTTVALVSGDRVIVTVNSQFRPLLPLVPFTTFPIRANSSRTLTGEIDLNTP